MDEHYEFLLNFHIHESTFRKMHSVKLNMHSIFSDWLYIFNIDKERNPKINFVKIENSFVFNFVTLAKKIIKSDHANLIYTLIYIYFIIYLHFK